MPDRFDEPIGEIAIVGVRSGFADELIPGRIGMDSVTLIGSPGVPCSPADMAEPYGMHNTADLAAFLAAMGAQQPAADLAPPTGVFEISDALA